MILKFNNNKKIELYSPVYEYLYPYLVRFSLKYNVDKRLWSEKEIIYISDENRDSFIQMLEKIVDELLEDLYQEPTQRQRTRHPGYFQKIIYKEQKYVLNYTTDIIGKIAYKLIYIIQEMGNNG